MDNVDRMMSVGEIPWHKKGTILQNVATSAEAIVAASLTWEVEKRQVLYTSPSKLLENDTKTYKGKYVIVRKDREIPLGIVGNVYRPLQNKEAFSFFDAVVGTKEAMYHTAGSLGQGERVWILAKLPGTIKVTHEDAVEKYLLLANSHDGTSAVEMLFTPIRVVCQNTLNLAISSTTQKFTMRHTLSMGMKIEDVRKKLGIIHNQFDLFEQLSQRMVNVQTNQKDLVKYFEEIGVITKDEEGKYTTRTQNTLDTLVSLFEHGKGNDMPSVKGSLWAGYNSVVEYVDYIRGSDENRTKSILYGSGADVKQKAWDVANNIAFHLALK
jgi:phage/plasmid-like protein (TIGR03299 family)